MTTELDEVRGEIDAIDDELIRLLARRDDLVRRAWEWKAAHRLDERDPDRERAMRERLVQRARAHGLDAAAVLAVFERVIGRRLRGGV